MPRKPKIKRIIFYTEPYWAFGSIHSSLMRYLHPHFQCEILNYFENYSVQDIHSIDLNTDLWVTNWPARLINQYGIAPEKIAFVAHAKWDIYTTGRDLT